jgi:HEAT repeat protein
VRETLTGRSPYVAVSLLAAVTLLLTIMSAAEVTPATPDTREQAWAVLNEGLKHDHASHRMIAVQALSLMAKNRTAERLAMRALKDHDTKVRASAATTLGQLHARQAIPALREALQDPEIVVVLSAAQALYLMKDPSAYDIYYAILMGDRKSSNGLLQSQLDRLKDPKQMMQLGIQEGISFVPFGGMGYEAFRELKSHNGDSARASAARFLARDPDQITEDALLQTAVADKNEEVRLAALDALAERGDPKCIERLAMNLNEDKSAVRYRTAAAILHLGDLEKRPKR